MKIQIININVEQKNETLKLWLYGHKTFEYEFYTRSWKTPNQNIISNRYRILIGRF
jgi:hypothetical protein